MTKNIFRTLTIIWMIIIFSFSARTGVDSTGDSHNVGMFIGNVLIHDFDEWSEVKQTSFAEKIDYPIRKTAHASEYAVLGIFLVGAVFCLKYGKVRLSRYKTAWILGTVYAASDEIHQLFVPGRSGRVTDVMIDSMGVFIGVIVCYVIKLIFEKLNIKKAGRFYE